MKTCKQIAIEWGISERTVTNLCKEGKIPGASKAGRSWQIPDDAVKPIDKRVISGKYKKQSGKKNIAYRYFRLCSCTVGILLCG